MTRIKYILLTWLLLTVTACGGGSNSTAPPIADNSATSANASTPESTASNDPPTATNLTSTAAYTEGATSVAIDDIVIADVDTGDMLTATLTLNDVNAGVLTTSGAGNTYDAGTGVWTMTDTAANVNTALAAMTFTPNINYDLDTTITTHIEDQAGTGPIDGVITLDFSRNWDLRRVSPDAVNTDQASVDAILNFIFTDQAIQSVLISKNGFTIGERYADGYDKDSYGTSWSVAKSFYSAAIGVAIDEGLIASVDINVSDIITEWQNTDKADITLKQVLQMRSGYASGTEVFFAADQTLHAINLPLESTPDSLFRYSNANTQLLSPILARTTSQTAHQYLVNKILAPIGIDTTSVGLWFDSTATNPMTYCCLDMRPDDFARFGLLYARNGNWQGEQIVSSDYVVQSMLATSAPYGYQWWILNDTFYGGSQPPIDITAALGRDGQKIYVWPQKDIVIVVLTKYIHAMNQGYVLDLRPDVLNFPDTCTGRNTCSGSQGPAVANYNEFRLIRLIQALDND
jgi:CubicO group peptidase (beta-lactamase class C family)